MLFLISIGISDEKDMSLRALEVAKSCDYLFFERYTSKIATNCEKLKNIIGKEIIELKREDLEEGSEKIIKLAKDKNVGILIPGDALVATTHIALAIEARKNGIDVKIIHGSSIFTAVSSTGLQLYKFGRTATLPKFKAESIKEIVDENKKRGVHTLLLIDPEISIRDALERICKEEIVKEDEKIVIYSNYKGDEIILYGFPKELANSDLLKDENQYSIIIPGKLHFMEEEALVFFSNKNI
ncbi:MAG: diphthine synthase [Candidatus Aenigmatarchaeota archaeon]